MNLLVYGMHMNTALIVKALKERQVREGWTFRDVGRELGINYTTWYGITRGRHGPGVAFIRAVLARFPEYTPLLFVPLDVHDSHVDVTSDEQEAA